MSGPGAGSARTTEVNVGLNAETPGRWFYEAESDTVSSTGWPILCRLYYKGSPLGIRTPFRNA